MVFPVLSQLLATATFLHPMKEAKPYPTLSGYHGRSFATALELDITNKAIILVRVYKYACSVMFLTRVLSQRSSVWGAWERDGLLVGDR